MAILFKNNSEYEMRDVLSDKDGRYILINVMNRDRERQRQRDRETETER